jgi:Flp pilus assembly protein TadG
VLTTVLMTVIAGTLAFALDLGYIAHVRTDLQRTADASALAAAELLPEQYEAAELARAAAAENGWSSGVNLGPGDEDHGEDLDPMTVEFGFWHRDAATFTSPPPWGRPANAVRVTLRRTEATRNPLRLFFARVFGSYLADVTASATAWSDHGICGPFVGIEWLDVGGGAITDSYDSYEGPYNPDTAGDRGSVCSDGPLDVHGNSIVNGDALAGEGDIVSVDGTAQVTGHIGNRTTPLNLPPVDASDAAINNDNDQAPPVWQGQSWRDPIRANGDFSLNAGEVYELPPGTYYFRNVTLNGSATLNFSGETTIYVTGTFRREGGCWVNNNTQLAKNLQILSTGGTIDITSDNDFYGVFYAPQSRVTLNGDADLFGAIVGNTLKINGSGTAHYDETLDLEYLEVPPRTMLVD